MIFDSQAAIGAGQGVYMSAVAKVVEDDETARPIEAFSRRPGAQLPRREPGRPGPAEG